MDSGQPADMSDDTPLAAFSSVWVKMEVDDDGAVEGLDEDTQNTEENDQDTEENSQESQDVQVPVRRSRRKPAAPRKAKNVEEKIFQCEFCDYKALHKSTLNYHLMKHTKPTPMPCTMCSYTTNHAASLRRHMLGVHTDMNDPIIQAMPDIKCKDCDYTCKFSWKLFIHKRKHVEKSFHCDQCDFATGRKSNFEKHFKTHKHRDSAVYECDKCPFVTKHEGHISRHLAVIHKEVSSTASKCEFCDFSTQVKWRLNVHKKNSKHEKPIKCEFCDFITDYNCQYKLHKQQHINDMVLVASGVDIPITEQLAVSMFKPAKGKANATEGSAFDSPSTNDKEFIVDPTCAEIDWRSIEVGEKPGQEKPFHCILCQYTSKFKAAVQRHFQRNHTSDNSKPYKCLNCTFSTKTRDQISLHSKRSKSTYQTCKVCDFATYYKCQMAEHQRIHWRFNCKLCDYVCRVKYDLNQHYTVVHLGQGLKCRFCDFQAARKGSLLNHETTHTNKRFRCGLCDYSATRRNLLFNHMKRCHAGERPKIIISDRKFDFINKVCEEQSGNVESGKNGESSDNVESRNESVGDRNDRQIKFENEKSFEFTNQLGIEENDEIKQSSQLKHDKSGENVASGVSVENQNKFESEVNVESQNKFESGMFVESQNKFESGAIVKSQNKFESGINVESMNKFESGMILESQNKFESGMILENQNKFESGAVVKSQNKFESGINVESMNKFESGMIVESQNKFESGAIVKSQNKFESGINVESMNKFESGVIVESRNKFESGVNIESRNKFETQVYVERENEYESKSLEFQRDNMFQGGSLRNETQIQRNMFQMDPRPNMFYSL